MFIALDSCFSEETYLSRLFPRHPSVGESMSRSAVALHTSSPVYWYLPLSGWSQYCLLILVIKQIYWNSTLPDRHEDFFYSVVYLHCYLLYKTCFKQNNVVYFGIPTFLAFAIYNIMFNLFVYASVYPSSFTKYSFIFLVGFLLYFPWWSCSFLLKLVGIMLHQIDFNYLCFHGWDYFHIHTPMVHIWWTWWT